MIEEYWFEIPNNMESPQGIIVRYHLIRHLEKSCEIISLSDSVHVRSMSDSRRSLSNSNVIMANINVQWMWNVSSIMVDYAHSLLRFWCKSTIILFLIIYIFIFRCVPILTESASSPLWLNVNAKCVKFSIWIVDWYLENLMKSSIASLGFFDGWNAYIL